MYIIEFKLDVFGTIFYIPWTHDTYTTKEDAEKALEKEQQHTSRTLFITELQVH